MKKPLTLPDLMEHHDPYARRLADEHALGPLQSRGVEGKPADAVRTGVAVFRFARGTVTWDGTDYRIEKEVTP